ERLRPIGARAVGRARRGRTGHRLVEREIVALTRAAEDDPRMQRIARRVAALAAGADRLPVAHRDLAELAARADGDGARILLRAGHPVREAIVDRDVVELRRRLIEPRAPGDLTRIFRP